MTDKEVGVFWGIIATLSIISCFGLGYLVGRGEHKQVADPHECVSVCVEIFDDMGC